MSIAPSRPISRLIPTDDPTYWLLNARTGWRVAHANRVEIDAEGGLTLEPLPAARRRLNEQSGAFGGLVLPNLAALDDGGNLYVLETPATLKLFDRCQCRFVPIPCFAGSGNAPRQLQQVGGMAICNGNLFVADSGNGVVKVFALYGWALRALWRPPRNVPEANWTPSAVACDRHGRVYVADSAQGLVHRFMPSGRWSIFASGVGNADAITVDNRGDVHVAMRAAAGVLARCFAFTADGDPLVVEPRVERLAEYFPRLPVSVDPQGNLDLSDLCFDTTGISLPLRFDSRGNLLATAPNQKMPLPIVYAATGDFYCTALDSGIYHCQWHRVILNGRIPEGTRLTVATFTSEIELTTDALLDLPAEAWAVQPAIVRTTQPGGGQANTTQASRSEPACGEWDGLIRSGGGRYLWLRLAFESTGVESPCLTRIVIEYPRISLRRYLPAVFGLDPASADFIDRFLSLFDTTLREVESEIDTQARLFDPMAAPSVPIRKRQANSRRAMPDSTGAEGGDFLSWLASWIGLTLDRHMAEATRRKLVAQAARLYHLRGTRAGLYKLLLLLLGLDQPPDCRCSEMCGGGGKCGCGVGARQGGLCCVPAPTLPAHCLPPPKPPTWSPPPLILEHFQLRRWLYLGAGRLGDQAELWGRRIVNRSQLDQNAQIGQTQIISTQDPLRDPFHVYAHKFSVFVPARFGHSERQRRSLQALVRAETPAHTQFFLEFVEPRMRIGSQAVIGLNTVVACYPAGIVLGDSRLGSNPQAVSVLSGPPAAAHGPKLQIGRMTRLG